MRLFLAIHLSDAAIEHLRRVQAHCRSIAPDGNFTRDVNLHLTVRFLGETKQERLDPLKKILRRTISGGPLRLAASRLLSFPPNAPARILGAHVGGEMGQQLILLQASIERAVRSAGFAPDEKQYHPHVTLARPDRPIPLPAYRKMEQLTAKSWPGPTFDVRHIHLMESEPSPAGSKYRQIAEFDLYGENSD